MQSIFRNERWKRTAKKTDNPPTKKVVEHEKYLFFVLTKAFLNSKKDYDSHSQNWHFRSDFGDNTSQPITNHNSMIPCSTSIESKDGFEEEFIQINRF